MATIRKRVRCNVQDANDHGRFKRQLRAAERQRARRLSGGGGQATQGRRGPRQLGWRAVVARERCDSARGACHERPAGAGQYVDARLRSPVHERFSLGFGDVFDENDERLDAHRGEPRGLPFPTPSRERRAHRFRCLRGERGHLHRSACTTCSRAARSAGKKPPMTPMTTANVSPANRSSGVTRKLNAISLKLDQFVVPVTMPLRGSAKRQPRMPPMTAMNADSARKLTRTVHGLKPSVSRTPISGAREEIAAYIVLIAPKTAPTAMMLVIMTARKPRMVPSSRDCWAQKSDSRCTSTVIRLSPWSERCASSVRAGTTRLATCAVSNTLPSGTST